MHYMDMISSPRWEDYNIEYMHVSKTRHDKGDSPRAQRKLIFLVVESLHVDGKWAVSERNEWRGSVVL
jgi:hypothetical protein